MSFFGQKLPSPQKKSLLDDPNLNSTAEQARPLQYVAGWQRVGITWIDMPRNQRSVPKKSGKGGATTGYKYYADMVALVCHGPIDGITHVLMDDNPEWQGLVRRGNEQFIVIPLKRGGDLILYWGRADQTAEPTLAALGHPPYRGQCYGFLPQLSFGLGRTNAPNVELGIIRHPPVAWLTGTLNQFDDENPAVILADLLTNPIYGIGLDPALFDQAQWLATAQQLATEDALFSPVISDAVGVRQLITQICEYCYGYLRWTRGNLLQLGLLRDTPTDLTPLLKLGASDLIDPPDITTSEWTSTFNRTVVPCVERLIYWQESYGQYNDSGNLAITNQMLFQSLDRRWITRTGVANNLAQLAGKRFALPMFTGTIKVRRSSVAAVEIGDWIALNYDAEFLGFALALQVTGYKASGETTEEIELNVEGQQITTDPAELTGNNPVQKAAPAAPSTVTALAQWTVLELPTMLSGGKPGVVVTALAVRGASDTILANVLDSQDDTTYDLLGSVTDFASGGVLAAAYPTTADVTVPLTINLLGPDLDLPSVSALAAQNDKLLVFVGQEILAVQAVTVVSAQQVQLFCLRAQYDAPAQAHAVGDQAYIIPKRNLQPLTLDAFAGDNSVWFKVQAISLGDSYDLALVNSQQLGVLGRALLPAPPTTFTANGAVGAATFQSGGNTAFAWKLQSYSTPYLASVNVASEIHIYDNVSSLTQKDSITLAPGVGALTYTNAQLTAAFGGTQPTSFYVRLWSLANGFYSYSYLDCVVTLAGSPGGGGGNGGGIGSPGRPVLAN